MQRRKTFSKQGVVFAVLLAGTLVNAAVQLPAKAVSKIVQSPSLVATLGDGNYQFCSQIDPQDWRDGAGICFNFAKVGNLVDGYYGYPHSDDFICVRGKVNSNAIAGEALALSWAGNEWVNIPTSAFTWDREGRLTLHQGNIIRSINQGGEGRMDWIKFDSALLNLDGFYQYSRPRMTPPSQLCNWNSK
jgi:hypothetical protein